MCQEICIVTAQAAATSVRQHLSFSSLAVQHNIFLLYTKEWVKKRKLNEQDTEKHIMIY